MPAPTTGPKSEVTLASLAELGIAARLWQKTLRAEGKSPKTIETYTESVVAFGRWLLLPPGPDEETKTLDPTRMTKALLLDFMGYQLQHYKATTASVRFRALQRFFAFLVEEGDIKRSPMEGMKPPTLPEELVPVISDEDLTRLLQETTGTSFLNRRDHALVRFLLDTGVRVAEAAGITMDKLDADQDLAQVLGKGNKWRGVVFGNNTSVALNRYLKARARYVTEHHLTYVVKEGGQERRERITPTTGPLWVGIRGALSTNGIEQMLQRRCTDAGIDNVNPHRFRHTFSHKWLEKGGQEGDLMALNGWTDPKMPKRYGKSASASRAQKAHRIFSPGDDF